jgi:hypothetical protein
MILMVMTLYALGGLEQVMVGIETPKAYGRQYYVRRG